MLLHIVLFFVSSPRLLGAESLWSKATLMVFVFLDFCLYDASLLKLLAWCSPFWVVWLVGRWVTDIYGTHKNIVSEEAARLVPGWLEPNLLLCWSFWGPATGLHARLCQMPSWSLRSCGKKSCWCSRCLVKWEAAAWTSKSRQVYIRDVCVLQSFLTWW